MPAMHRTAAAATTVREIVRFMSVVGDRGPGAGEERSRRLRPEEGQERARDRPPTTVNCPLVVTGDDVERLERRGRRRRSGVAARAARGLDLARLVARD